MAGRKFLRQEVGAVLLLVLAFIGLAVPLTIGAIQIAGQLNLLSRVYDRLLRSHYSASAGAELAFWQVLNVSGFGDNLTPLDPCTEMVFEIGGDPVTVRVCRVFTTVSAQGQGIIITKSVTPTAVQAGQSTTFTYTMTLDNQGTGTVTLEGIYDYLPPYFTYVLGSTRGITILNPSPSQSTTICGSNPYRLIWDVGPANVTIQTGQQRTLTFQATANLPNGTYYNQALVSYVPWWTTNTVDVYSPYTAPVVAGTGSPYCGYELNVLVTKTVDPAIGNPGVEQEFTYTISATNMSSTTRYVCKIDDILPPTFVYVAGSSAEYPSNMDLAEPDLIWDAVSERWKARWVRWLQGQGQGDMYPLVSLAPGAASTQVFRARATPQPGANYFNEASALWFNRLAGGHCKQGTGDSGTTYSGASETSEVHGTAIYDIEAISSDGTVQARIQYYEASGQIQIISWQEY